MAGTTTASVKNRNCTEGLSSSKHKKYCKKENEDRISSLPDVLVCHILSFLPTKYAVGSSILFTRWRYLWAFVPVLRLDERLIGHKSSYKRERRRLFKTSVPRVLSSHIVQSIQKFCLTFSEKYELSLVNIWISFAIMHNVVELDLHLCIGKDEALHLPLILFSCEKLKVLKLGVRSRFDIILNILHSVHLPSLKVLHLSFLERVNEASMRKLLSGALVLEHLEIYRYIGTDVQTLYLNSCSLKSLMILNHDFFEEHEEIEQYRVVVDGPKLELLVRAGFLFEELKLHLPSIVESEVDIGINDKGFDDYANEVLQLLNQIPTVKYLCLTDLEDF